MRDPMLLSRKESKVNPSVPPKSPDVLENLAISMETLKEVKETREPIRVNPASLVKVMPVPVEMELTEELESLVVKAAEAVEELKLAVIQSLLL